MLKNKKILLMILLVLLLIFLPNMVKAATIQATETTTTSTGKTVNWRYELDSSNNIVKLECTNVATVQGEVTIPSTIDGHTVVELNGDVWGGGTFKECSGLTGITIPNTVTAIGNYAFRNCTGLKTVTLHNSITSVGKEAFEGCVGLVSVTFSNNLSSIGDRAFYNCTGLKSISFPSSLTTIGSEAFYGCSGLKKLVIPDNVTEIKAEAFEGCRGLKDVTLSKNLTSLNSNTFGNCSGITSIIIPESVTTIGKGDDSWYSPFRDCANLEKILIPDSVVSIQKDAFKDCENLTIYGNDGQVSKSYAEKYGINFKYISQWNESNVGEDITPPYVESIQVPYSSVSSYYDLNSTTYIVPTGKVLIINVKFNENIVGTETPKLTIKFGSGPKIELTKGTISGSTIAYTYTITKNDVGTMTAVSLSGGNITDEAKNEAKLSCPELKVSLSNHYIYANGTSTDVSKDKDKNNNQNTNSNTQNEQKNNNVNSNNNQNSNKNTQKDNTIAPGTMPYTGGTFFVILAVLGIASVAIYVYKRNNDLKGI